MTKFAPSLIFFFAALSISSQSLGVDGPEEDKNSVLIQPKEVTNTNILQTLQVAIAYIFPNHRGVGADGFVPVDFNRRDYADIETSSSEIAADPAGGRNDMGIAFSGRLKAYYTLQMKFPWMTRDNSLMRDNNLALKLKANLSPISFEAGPYLEITPIAFLVFEIGTKAGTGWDFFNMSFNGLAINDPNHRYTEKNTRFENSTGIVSITNMKARLQLDTAALLTSKNKDWFHILFAVSQNISYRYFSGANSNQYWRWEHNEGENQNGFIWEQDFFVGYKMPQRPVHLEMIGFLAQTDQRITGKNKSTMKEGGWGSDFIRCTFGPLVQFKFTDEIGLTLLTQFRTERRYTDDTVGYRYFELREVDTRDSSYVYFYRTSLVMNTKF